jgi:methylase of polypeptide subunit release factors
MKIKVKSKDYVKLRNFFNKYYSPLYKIIANFSLQNVHRHSLLTSLMHKKLKKEKRTFLLFKLFYLNEDIKLRELVENFSLSEINLLSKFKTITFKDSRVSPNFFVLPARKIIFSDPQKFKKRKNFVGVAIETIWFLQFINKYNLANDAILDVGSGNGVLALGINKYKRIIGCDINKRSLFFANFNKKLHLARRITFLHSNYTCIIKKYKFDTIVCNPPHKPDFYPKILYSCGGETGFEFTKNLIEDFLSSNAKRLFLITLSPVIKGKSLISELLNSSQHIGYELISIVRLPSHSIVLSADNKKEILRKLLKKNIKFFDYCFVKIEKNSKKRISKRMYSSFSKFSEELKGKFFFYIPHPIFLLFIRIYSTLLRI